MKPAILSIIFAISAVGQVVFTPDKPASEAQPGSMTMTDATQGAPAVSCTVLANAVPATSIAITCSVSGVVTEVAHTVAVPNGATYTVSWTAGANSVIAMFTGSASGLAVSAATHATAPAAQGTW